MNRDTDPAYADEAPDDLPGDAILNALDVARYFSGRTVEEAEYLLLRHAPGESVHIEDADGTITRLGDVKMPNHQARAVHLVSYLPDSEAEPSVRRPLPCSRAELGEAEDELQRRAEDARRFDLDPDGPDFGPFHLDA